MVENITLRNTVTGKALDMDKITTQDYILDYVDWGTISSEHHSSKYVGQVGTTITGTSLGTRSVEITGWVVADTPAMMTANKARLNGFVNPQQPVILYYKEHKLTVYPETTVKYSASVEENNEVICKFSINGLCPDPLFSDEVDNKVTAASTKPLFHFPLVTSENPNPPGGVVFGIRQPSLLTSIQNVGDVDVGFKIVFKANGDVTNPSLVDVNTQEFMRINKKMTVGEEITIVTSTGKKSIKGNLNGITSNYFKYKDFDSSWLTLKRGDNLLRYDAADGIENLDVYIYYSNKYLEVQQCY